MFSEEWPLMMFTLLCQLAVGSYIILLFIRNSLEKNDRDRAAQLTDPGLKMVGPVMAAALLLSVFHLGTPLGAYRSILNLETSWLSREIITAGGFFAFWCLSFLSIRQGKMPAWLGIVTSVFGLAAVFSMASIYTTSVRPVWTDTNTYLAFYGATFATGCLFAACSVAVAAKGETIPERAGSILKTVAFVAAVAVLVPALYTPILVSSLKAGPTAANASAALISDTFAMPLVIRAVLSLAGVWLLYAAVKNQIASLNVSRAAIALLLVLAGEFVGRYVFYATAVSIFTGNSLI